MTSLEDPSVRSDDSSGHRGASANDESSPVTPVEALGRKTTEEDDDFTNDDSSPIFIEKKEQIQKQPELAALRKPKPANYFTSSSHLFNTTPDQQEKRDRRRQRRLCWNNTIDASTPTAYRTHTNIIASRSGSQTARREAPFADSSDRIPMTSRPCRGLSPKIQQEDRVRALLTFDSVSPSTPIRPFPSRQRNESTNFESCLMGMPSANQRDRSSYSQAPYPPASYSQGFRQQHQRSQIVLL
eukprot:Selendium_serpulae@DN5566_c0_g1_i6.p1